MQVRIYGYDTVEHREGDGEYFMGPITGGGIVIDGSPPQVVDIRTAEGRVRLVFETYREWDQFLSECDQQIQFEEEEDV